MDDNENSAEDSDNETLDETQFTTESPSRTIHDYFYNYVCVIRIPVSNVRSLDRNTFRVRIKLHCHLDRQFILCHILYDRRLNLGSIRWQVTVRRHLDQQFLFIRIFEHRRRRF